MKKTDKLKPRVLDSLERLKKFIELDAPAPIIGIEAWILFKVVLSTYGISAGMSMIGEIRDHDLHSRAVCANEDCIEYVDRWGSGICSKCEKELGIDNATMDALDATAVCEHNVLLSTECQQCEAERGTRPRFYAESEETK